MIKKFLLGEEAAILTEYGLLAVLIAVVAVGAVFLFGESVLALYHRLDPSVFD